MGDRAKGVPAPLTVNHCFSITRSSARLRSLSSTRARSYLPPFCLPHAVLPWPTTPQGYSQCSVSVSTSPALSLSLAPCPHSVAAPHLNSCWIFVYNCLVAQSGNIMDPECICEPHHRGRGIRYPSPQASKEAAIELQSPQSRRSAPLTGQSNQVPWGLCAAGLESLHFWSTPGSAQKTRPCHVPRLGLPHAMPALQPFNQPASLPSQGSSGTSCSDSDLQQVATLLR